MLHVSPVKRSQINSIRSLLTRRENWVTRFLFYRTIFETPSQAYTKESHQWISRFIMTRVKGNHAQSRQANNQSKRRRLISQKKSKSFPPSITPPYIRQHQSQYSLNTHSPPRLETQPRASCELPHQWLNCVESTHVVTISRLELLTLS